MFTSTNSTSVPLKFESGVVTLGFQQSGSFSLLEHNCSHSGTFGLNRNITSTESFTNARIKDFVRLGEYLTYHSLSDLKLYNLFCNKLESLEDSRTLLSVEQKINK